MATNSKPSYKKLVTSNPYSNFSKKTSSQGVSSKSPYPNLWNYKNPYQKFNEKVKNDNYSKTHSWYGGGSTGGGTTYHGGGGSSRPSQAEINRRKAEAERKRKIAEKQKQEMIKNKTILNTTMGLGSAKYKNKLLDKLKKHQKEIVKPYEGGLEYLRKAQEYYNIQSKTAYGKKNRLKNIAAATSIGAVSSLASIPKAAPEMITGIAGAGGKVVKTGFKKGPKEGLTLAGAMVGTTAKDIYNYYNKNPTQLLADTLTFKVIDSVGRTGKIGSTETKAITKIKPSEVSPKLRTPLNKLKSIAKRTKTGEKLKLTSSEKDIFREVKSKWNEAQMQKYLKEQESKLIKKAETERANKLKEIKKYAKKQGLKN